MITSTDPVADMLARIRNAIAVRKTEVSLPYSKFKEAVAISIKANGFLDDVSVSGEGVEKTLTIKINDEAENARITEVKRLSKPGRRQYSFSSKIPKVKYGRGVVIVSTSQGLMTGAEAKAKGLGGELICEVY